jgi:hypothetical protein
MGTFPKAWGITKIPNTGNFEPYRLSCHNAAAALEIAEPEKFVVKVNY